jgi:hypothetical protein
MLIKINILLVFMYGSSDFASVHYTGSITTSIIQYFEMSTLQCCHTYRRCQPILAESDGKAMAIHRFFTALVSSGMGSNETKDQVCLGTYVVMEFG